MASKKGIDISEHHVVSIDAMPFHLCTSNFKKLKGRTESYFYDHQKRCLNFGLRQFYPNGCKFELN